MLINVEETNRKRQKREKIIRKQQNVQDRLKISLLIFWVKMKVTVYYLVYTLVTSFYFLCIYAEGSMNTYILH